jgi:hypothetical protein
MLPASIEPGANGRIKPVLSRLLILITRPTCRQLAQLSFLDEYKRDYYFLC